MKGWQGFEDVSSTSQGVPVARCPGRAGSSEHPGRRLACKVVSCNRGLP